jgi:hypothetical protein
MNFWSVRVLSGKVVLRSESATYGRHGNTRTKGLDQSGDLFAFVETCYILVIRSPLPRDPILGTNP